MRILSVALAILMSVVTVNARAWSMWEMNGAKMDIDGKDVRVASVKMSGTEHVFHSHDKEFEKGVYVVATLYESSTQGLPQTTALIRDYLRSRGFNVSDKPDGSALGIKFAVFDLNIDGINIRNQAPSQSKNLSDQGTDLAAKASTIALITKMSGAMAGVAAYGGAGSAHYSGNELTMSGEIVADPTYEKMGDDTIKYVRDKDVITAHTAEKQSDPKTTTGDLLLLMTKVWTDKYFVKD